MCDAFHDLVLFVQFKRCEKHPWELIELFAVQFYVICDLVPFMQFKKLKKHP